MILRYIYGCGGSQHPIPAIGRAAYSEAGGITVLSRTFTVLHVPDQLRDTAFPRPSVQSITKRLTIVSKSLGGKNP